MPSKKRSNRFKQVSKMDVLTEALPQQSEKAFRQLVSFVNASEGLTIGFIESNFKPDTDSVLEAFRHDPTCLGIQFEVLNFPDPQLRFVRDLIVQALQNIQIVPDKKLVLIIRGLEQSIGMTGDYPPMLQDLNFVRDDFVKSIPHPLLFCLPDYAITRLARYAPDFWAWKSGLFRFQTSPSAQANALSQTLNSERIRGGLDLAEKQERIDLLQRLLMEYQPSGHAQTQASLKSSLNILNELGVLYRSQGDVVKAEQMFQDALAQITDEPELLSVKASVLHELGLLYKNLGKPEEAIALYEQSLELQESIGDVQGKAATLHNLANIYANQGEVEKAIALYAQSLELQERIGNVQGKAAALHQMAGIYANQGNVEKAIALYEQSLQLQERIGNVQGKAATLHCMAGIYTNQGEVEKAIALYEQSLQLQERIGNVQGKAATLHCMAGIYTNQGEVEKVIALYEQSLELTECIGDVQGKAATLHNLADIYANQGEVEKAITLYEQSLEIKERIGNVQGKATTLHQMAGIYTNQGDVEKAIALYEQSLELTERIGNVQTKAATLHNLADIYANQGEVEKAIALYEQSLEIERSINHIPGLPPTLTQLAQLLAMQGNFNQAVKYTYEAMGILTHLKSPDAQNVQSILLSILLASSHAEQIQQLLSQGDTEGIQTLIQQIVQTGT
jgi:tetratricopeptide (TPR) repeat protein